MPAPYLPSEILDYIIDLAPRDDPKTLKQCCLVSKSWVPHIRRHLFYHVEFKVRSDLVAWRKLFPDPKTTPAIYTRSLRIHCPEHLTAARSWIRSFTGVIKLEVLIRSSWEFTPKSRATRRAFALFRNPSSNLRYLRVVSPGGPVWSTFDFIRSFPHLKDLDVLFPTDKNLNGIVPQHSRFPTLRGILVLRNQVERVISFLSRLPNGFCFRKIVWRGYHSQQILVRGRYDLQELPWVKDLIKRCSATLECIDVECSTFTKPCLCLFRHLMQIQH